MTNITNYTIEQLYQAHLNNPSDINEHLANLRAFLMCRNSGSSSSTMKFMMMYDRMFGFSNFL